MIVEKTAAKKSLAVTLALALVLTLPLNALAQVEVRLAPAAVSPAAASAAAGATAIGLQTSALGAQAPSLASPALYIPMASAGLVSPAMYAPVANQNAASPAAPAAAQTLAQRFGDAMAVAGAAAATAAAPQVDSAQYALAVRAALESQRSAALEVVKILQAAGVGTDAKKPTAATLMAVANAMPAGSPAAAKLAAFAQAMAAGPGAARRYALDRGWENVSAPYSAPELLPAEETPAGQEARLTDLSRLRVPESRLRWTPDASLLPASTEEVAGEKNLVIGSEQGVHNLIRGLRMNGRDTMVYASGEDSVGKVKATVREAQKLAADMERPEDWVQVRNFSKKGEPQLLRLPAGTGARFKEAVDGVLESMENIGETLAKLDHPGKVKNFLDKMIPKLQPKIDALSAEVGAVTIKDAFKLQYEFKRYPAGFRSGIKLVDLQGNAVGEEDVEKLVKGKPYDAAAVMQEFQEKAGEFQPKINETMAPLAQAMSKMQKLFNQESMQAVAEHLKDASKPLAQIAGRMHMSPAAQAHHDAEMAKYKESAEAEMKKATDEAAARTAAWEAKLPAFDADGFGLAIVQVPQKVNIMGMELVVPAKGLGVTYKGKALDDPATIKALQKENIIPSDADLAQMTEQLKAKLGKAAEGQTLPTGLDAVLGQIREQVMEAASGVLDQKNQIDEELQAKAKELQQRLNDKHEALHKGDHGYEVTKWVNAFVSSLAQNFRAFTQQEDEEPTPQSQMAKMLGLKKDSDPADEYKTRVVVDNARLEGAPVIVADDYSWHSFFGAAKSNKRVMMGPGGPMAAADDDAAGPELSAGYLQKANGGFLVVEAEKLLRHPEIYHALMDMAGRGQAEFTEDGILSILYDRSGRYPAKVDVKIIMTGPAMYRHMLAHYDPQFAGMFNMIAEFESAMYVGGAQAAKAVGEYLRFMRNVVDQWGLLHFSQGAISRVLEQAARMADSNEKIASVLKPVERLMREAALYAKDAGHAQVQREDVDKAITETMESESLYRDMLYNLIADGTFWVNVDGQKNDTITGMAVIGGGEGFGVPSRISVEVYAGKGGDIVASTEEKAEIVGSSFKQSVGNVAGFFLGKLGRTHVLPFQARVKFEQNYGGIDGDSATQTMIYLIGASMAGVPIKQNFAITGSADQHGNVQAIGGINHKIEGSWDVFTEMRRRQGKPLTKDEPYNILFPASNIRELALRPDVAQAVKDGLLNIIPVVHVSQGFELLTGVPYATLVKSWREYREKVLEDNREKKDDDKKAAPAAPAAPPQS